MVGLFLFAFGIVLLLESELGLSPWDVLNQGISDHTALSFGTANILVALCVLVVAWLLGAKVGPGTVANAVCIGLFVDGLLSVSAIDSLSDSPLGARIVFMFKIGVLRVAAPTAPPTAGAAVVVSGLARDVEQPLLEKLGADGSWLPSVKVAPDADGAFAVTVRPKTTSTYRLTADGKPGPALTITVPAGQAK